MKRRLICGLLVGFGLGVITCGQGYAARTIYDTFSENYIDGAKWSEGELVREVASGRLVSKAGNTSTTPYARNQAIFQNPASIQTIQCQVNVVEANLDTAADPESYARVCGRFYNTMNSGTEKGDIWAGLYIGNRGSGLEAWWLVIEALDDGGESWEEKGSGSLNVQLSYNLFYTVKLAYNGANRFTFTVAGVSAPFDGPLRAGAEFTKYKALETVVSSQGGAGTGYVSALYDNVYLNNEGTAYETFAGPLTKDRWRSWEAVREHVGGKLRLSSQGFDAQAQMTSHFMYYNTPYVEAKVRIGSDSLMSMGANGVARIQGYYYNDSKGPGSGQDYNGYEGDVFAQIRLRYDGSGSLSADAFVDRCNDANESNYSSLFTHNFPVTISLDTDYTLSIVFEDGAFTFKCDDEIANYLVETPTYVPYGAHRALRARVYLDPGESGYINARFDDVYVDVVLGDLNLDKQVSLSDAILALQLTAAFVPPQPVYKEADMSGDGKIGLEEAIFVLQDLSGLR